MKVVIALDELNCANEVVEFVTKHSWSEGTEFSLIHVVTPVTLDMPMASYPNFLESISQAAQEDGRCILKTAAKAIKEKLNCEVHINLLIGHPTQLIVAQAKEWNADLIIVGSHGRKGVEKFFYGSVSEEISGAAHCSVLILRLPNLLAEAEKRNKETAQSAQVSTAAC